MSSQTASGKSFEYQLGWQIADLLAVEFCYSLKAQRSYDCQAVGEQLLLAKGAKQACSFLRAHDRQFGKAVSVTLQSEVEGQRGDPRDIIVALSCGQEIGISAKNRHQAIKHSRLSDRIDFGYRWSGFRCSDRYWEQIAPIFADLRCKKGQRFKDLQDKKQVIYRPVILAFKDEFERLYQSHGPDFVREVFRYLVGRKDYYQVSKHSRKIVIQSFNIGGSLGWGKKWKIPAQVDPIEIETQSPSTARVQFKGGWLFSFRVHNASSKVEPSLKFDVQLLAYPREVERVDLSLTS